MNQYHIKAITRRLAEAVDQKIDYVPTKELVEQNLNYAPNQIPAFIDALTNYARRYDLTLMVHQLDEEHFKAFLTETEYPVLYFEQVEGQIIPVITGCDLKGKKIDEQIAANGELTPWKQNVRKPAVFENHPDTLKNNKVIFLTTFPMKALVSDDASLHNPDAKPLRPLQRLMRLLGNEKKDIAFIYFYAIVVGLISLSLPLGIQAIINLISGGLVFSSVYVLIGLVIVGVLLSGVLQITQVTLVEILQRRIFAKAAFEFAYRIPRVRAEALLKYYPPELMNRFFDILNVQKSLPKLLIDITSAVLQILFGIILLSFYHPFFVIFGIVTLFALTLIIVFNGRKGLETSLTESKYKYKIAQWLEDVARTLYSFKLAGNTNLPIQKMDGLVNSYLTYRTKHFKILKMFYYNAVGFKVLIIGGLLILGTTLVVGRQISLGQFVASEIIIVLITGSIEKLIQSVDVIFDLLTAVEKLGTVTDLPLESEKGFKILPNDCADGLAVRVKDLKYKYPETQKYALNGIDLEISPGESVCVTGSNGSGKNTLLKILSGILGSFEGLVTYNGISIRDVNIATLRDYIEKNISSDDIFDGTILENITMGRDGIRLEDVRWVLDKLQIGDKIAKFPDGINTQMIAGGRRYAESFVTKITLARCIVAKPKLLMINDLLQEIEKKERLRIINLLTEKTNPWSLIVLSNDPMMMAACDRVIVMEEGKISAQGTFKELLKNPSFQEAMA